MHRTAFVSVTSSVILWFCVFAFPVTPVAETPSGQVGRILKERISEAELPPRVMIAGDEIPVSSRLPDFYRERGYRPAWQNGLELLKQAEDLIREIKESEEEGLRPYFYNALEIEKALLDVRKALSEGKPPDPERLADIDLLLTDGFLTYGFNLFAGRINPATIEGEWAETEWDADLTELLGVALKQNTIGEALQSVAPPHPGYYRLRHALKEYWELAKAGGWPNVPKGPKMELGYRGERVEILRGRLALSGDLDEEHITGGDIFDDAAEKAVIRFQRRHGLEVDGVVGPRTLEALNFPIEARIRQMELNMERWRWLPDELGKRYILVNIADFKLAVVENERTVMRMRIVVGKPYWHTPSFSGTMTYLVLNPSWNVPRSITVEDILPRLRDDPKYLLRQNFKVYRGWGARKEHVDPATIDWSGIAEQDLDFWLQQAPGPLNPLGHVKFMFPNRFNVYLHDTPSRGQFAMAVRTFSHGCIRVERPVELAGYLLSDNPMWSYGNILAEIGEGGKRSITLPEPIKVHLLYWTAWVDEEGSLQFRNDIYGRDRKLEEALLGKRLAS
jgi:murein L,D-transpeptidase YcbB/YkuD